jgi:hypothetical protein
MRVEGSKSPRVREVLIRKELLRREYGYRSLCDDLDGHLQLHLAVAGGFFVLRVMEGKELRALRNVGRSFRDDERALNDAARALRASMEVNGCWPGDETETD